MRLTQTFFRNEKVLLDHCKQFSGEYISNLNRHIAPFGTTYSKEFCLGATDLLLLYRKYEFFCIYFNIINKLVLNNFLILIYIMENDFYISSWFHKWPR